MDSYYCIPLHPCEVNESINKELTDRMDASQNVRMQARMW